MAVVPRGGSCLHLVIAGEGVVKVRLRHIKPAPRPVTGLSTAVDRSFHIPCLVATVVGA